MTGRRRVLAAGLVSLLFVAVVSLSVAARHYPLSFFELRPEVGRQVFLARCASCHSVDPAMGELAGPNLSTIGVTAGQRVPGMSAEEYLLESILRPDAFQAPDTHGVMPRYVATGLGSRDLVRLVAFLMQQGGRPDYHRVVAMLSSAAAPTREEGPPVDFVAAEEGRRLFLRDGRCATCHPLRPEPGQTLRAPSLTSAAAFDVHYLRESLVDPSRTITRGYENMIVHLDSGVVHSGRVLRRDDASLTLLDDLRTDPIVTLPMESIALGADGARRIRQGQHSTMPPAGDLGLSDAQVEQVMAFLTTLHGE